MDGRSTPTTAKAEDAGRTGPAAGAGGSGWSMWASELTLLLRRRRTWAMLVALAAIPVLIAVVVKVSADPVQPGQGPPFLDRVTQNGLFVSITALVVTIPLFLPLTVGVVAGDAVAGEAGLGTLRYLLLAPVRRGRLLLIKFAGIAMFCVLATAVIVTAGSVIGALLFPVDPVPLLSGDTIGAWEALGRALLVGAFVSVSMLGLGAVGLFISTLTVVPVGAMAATVVVAIVMQVLGALDQLAWLHPWLLNYYWMDFADLLRQPIAWGSFADSALLQAGYVAVFGALAYGRFATKDVLS
ncbi:ABC transporter permease [Pseudactinotalea sp. Z1732]|uniref:ABC transporter permease n=1 Tax=Pseudactinotalea sp. Z1732 TaxID=3413026 RepID=UPI003C7B464A